MTIDYSSNDGGIDEFIWQINNNLLNKLSYFWVTIWENKKKSVKELAFSTLNVLIMSRHLDS